MKRENLKRAKVIDSLLKALVKDKAILEEPEANRDVSLRFETNNEVEFVDLSKDEADALIVSLLELRSYDYNQLLRELETL